MTLPCLACMQVYDQGVADANAWLKEQGLLAAIGR